MEFGENKSAKRKALMNEDSARVDTNPWKLLRISSATFNEYQTHSATPYVLDSMIHNAGFTEATTKRFQERFETLEDLDKINKAIIATRIRMWKQAKCGQLRVMEAGKLTNGKLELPAPFAAYYSCLDISSKKLIELMNVHLDEKQFNEVMIICIKKYLQNNDEKDPRTIADQSEAKSSALKHEVKRKQIIRYYKFPPVEIPCSSCESCINDYEDKFFCVNCYVIMDKFSNFRQHKNKFKECKKKCDKWEKLRFEYGSHELIWGNRRRRPYSHAH